MCVPPCYTGSSQETAKADKSPSHDTQGPQRVTHQSPQPPPTPVIRPPQPEHPQPAHSAAAAPAAHTTTRHTQSAAQGAEEGDGKLLADPRLFARLRWGLRGEVVGIQSRDEVITTDDVLMRDQIRKVRKQLCMGARQRVHGTYLDCNRARLNQLLVCSRHASGPGCYLLCVYAYVCIYM